MKIEPQYYNSRRRPKQNFDINYDAIINDKQLTAIQKVLLINILSFHKVNKKQYGYILNADLCSIVVATLPTLVKHRTELERLNLFKIKVSHYDKMMEVDAAQRKNSPLYYYPNWTKLKSLNFIIEHEEDEFKKRFNNKIQNRKSKSNANTFPIKKGDSIMESSNVFKDDALYEIKTILFGRNGKQIGASRTGNMYGKTVKSLIKQEKNRLSRGERPENEYSFVAIVK